MFRKISWFRLASIILLIINVGIFIYVNRTPILWQQSEFGFYNMFWSTPWDSRGEFFLESGLHVKDFLKIFDSESLDICFRARNLSYMMEMLAMKAKQGLEVISFRSYSLIGFHFINVLLCYLIVFKETASKRAAIITSVLFLNSGIALSTLLFPFRNTKLMLMTLILSAWLWIISSRENLLARSYKHLAVFVMVLLAALFTDEQSIFFILLLFFLIIQRRDFFKKYWHKLLKVILLTFVIYALLRELVLFVDLLVNQSVAPPLLGPYIGLLKKYYSSIRVFVDLGQAFFAFFLRKNFGYWDLTLLGALSFFAFAGILVMAIRSPKSRDTAFKLKGLAVIVLMQLLLYFDITTIHLPGRHSPSMFFYNYYYTYPAALLFTLGIGLAFSQFVSRKKAVCLLALCLVTIISASNARHKDELLKSPLNIQGYYFTHRRVIPHILKFKETLSTLERGPVYLAFPSGSQPVFRRRLGDKDLWGTDPLGKEQQLHPDFVSYATLIPVQFLKPIERGDLVISLRNVAAANKTPRAHDLVGVKFFYDVMQDQWFDLDILRNSAPEKKIMPQQIKNNSFNQTIPLPAVNHEMRCLLLVKGATEIDIGQQGKVIRLHQRYGYSFQLFHFVIPPRQQRMGDTLQFSLTPKGKNQVTEFFGPFFIDSSQGHFGEASFLAYQLFTLNG